VLLYKPREAISANHFGAYNMNIADTIVQARLTLNQVAIVYSDCIKSTRSSSIESGEEFIFIDGSEIIIHDDGSYSVYEVGLDIYNDYA
jgi:hypothetical protein